MYEYFYENPLRIFRYHHDLYISDVPKKSYFLVRFYINGSFIQKTFYYNNKNKEIVRAKARRWRNRKFKKLIKSGKKKFHFGMPFVRRKVKKPTGISRVSLDHIKTLLDGRKKHIQSNHWVAQWVEYVKSGDEILRKQKKKSFTINKYGEKEAFSLALSYRLKIEEYLQSPEHIKLRSEYYREKSS